MDYAKTRYAFGRPVGSFQAIQHMRAGVLVDLELARSAAYYACGSTPAQRTHLAARRGS